jgi:hypothetical protein
MDDVRDGVGRMVTHHLQIHPDLSYLVQVGKLIVKEEFFNTML